MGGSENCSGIPGAGRNGGQGALNGRNCSGVACIPGRPRNFDRVTIEEWLIASPGTVRGKAGRREPPCVGKAARRLGMRLDAKSVLVLGWRRPGGSVRDQTDRGNVHTLERRELRVR